ncbi:MAG: RHS repeat-associated core domain-containing protein [Crenarchaeota archaeon]|nr:RHS repeat-associated core domain-containing protein [Thermoproteota archaeon]
MVVPLQNIQQINPMPYPTFCNLGPGGNETDLFFYHPDHLGSTGVITDNYASVTQGFLYAPFGELMYEHDPSWQNNRVPKYAFNAKELDEENGMYYYSARYYAPPTFISRDPMFEDYPSISPYTYCANNPMKFVDPTGMNLDDPPGDGNNPYKNQPIGYESGRGTEKNPIDLPEAIIKPKNPESQGETPQTPQAPPSTPQISTTPTLTLDGMKFIPSSEKGYNIIAAVTFLENNAEPSSVGYCAKYVRQALEAGGINTNGRPNSAKDYGPFLEGVGFSRVNTTNGYTPLIGDIAVISSFQGKNKNHPYGHIQMYSGSQWISDFIQRGFWPGSDYRSSQPAYKIYRY